VEQFIFVNKKLEIEYSHMMVRLSIVFSQSKISLVLVRDSELRYAHVHT